MKSMQKFSGDIEYLKRCKQSTPEQKLAWLAAAREFAMMPKKKVKKGK